MITEEQLRNWERAAAEAQPISINVVRIGDTWHAPIPNMDTEYTLTTIDFANDARKAVPALIAEVRRLQALLHKHYIVDADPENIGVPDVIFSTDPVATLEDVALWFGWPAKEAGALLDGLSGPPPVVYAVKPQTHTDAPPDSRPGSPQRSSRD